MVSKNTLLGSGIPPAEKEVAIPGPIPARRYHESCPEGIVVKTEAKLKELDEAGWVDHPGKVQLLPGHEKLFKGKESKEKKEQADEVKN